jgi:hypothetical protein
MATVTGSRTFQILVLVLFKALLSMLTDAASTNWCHAMGQFQAEFGTVTVRTCPLSLQLQSSS